MILRFCGLGLGLMLPLAAVEPMLPMWDDGEKTRLEEGGWMAGGLLLTDEPVPDMVEEKEVPLDVAKPTAEEIAESEIPPDVIPEKFWPAYFDERPKSFLVDPQDLLSSNNKKDRLGFLDYHASDSAIDLYLYVFKGEQEIPGEVREEELMERFFAEGRPAAVVFYYLGAPQRSTLFLSPIITDVVSAAEQTRALESSVMQAFEKLDASAQVEAFLVQTSIRLYWMERMMKGETVAESDSNLVARPLRDKGKEAGKSDKGVAAITQRLRPYLLPASVLGGAGCMVICLSAWMRRRARYVFPEFDVEPRLGASHAAGVGAVISFASASIPPASQRDQVPDYLRKM